MNQQQFEKQIDLIGDLYERIKDALNLSSAARLPMDDRKKVIVALSELTQLRDIACVNLKQLVGRNDITGKITPFDLHSRIRQADVHLSRCLFQMNKPTRGAGEADENVVSTEALNALQNLAIGLNMTDPNKFIL